MVTYGKEGTTYIFKPNLVRHMSGEAHQKCLEIETGEPPNKARKSIIDAFGSARDMAQAALKPLLVASMYLGRKEKPYIQFPDLLETVGDMGLKLTGAFNNDRAAKVFNHILAEQMVTDLREHVKNSNFCSWLLDGSAAAKHRLTYETELIYIRTAHQLQPKTELLAIVSMQPYAVVNSQNLLHALLKELLLLGDPSFKTHDAITKPVDEVESDELLALFCSGDLQKKVIGGGADGASINFGSKKGLMQLYKSSSDWLVAVHCFAHRLELAAKDALMLFHDVDDFLKELYLHFRNSHKEWSLVVKMGEHLNIGVLTQPKPYGTRFLPHVKGALSALRYNWMVFYSHFSDVKEQSKDKVLAAKAAAWLKMLSDFKFLVRCRVYEDILCLLSRTSLVFQSENAKSVADAQREFNMLMTEKQLLLEEAGLLEADVWDRLLASVDVPSDEVPHVRAQTRGSQPADQSSVKITLAVKVRRNSCIAHQGTPVSDQYFTPTNSSRGKFVDSDCTAEPLIVKNIVDKVTVSDIRKQAIENLDHCLSDRYAEFSKTSNVMSKLKFIDISTWPSDITSLSKYGNEDVAYLLKHFKLPLQNAGVESDMECLQEFKELKLKYGPQLQDDADNLKPSNFWPLVFRCDHNKFCHILLVVELIMCLPFSTATVERGFSSIRRILTDWRASLSHALVADCMHFSTRKHALGDSSYRNRLAEQAAAAFLTGAERDNSTDHLGTLTKRRINKVLQSLESRTCVETDHLPAHGIHYDVIPSSEVAQAGTSSNPAAAVMHGTSSDEDCSDISTDSD